MKDVKEGRTSSRCLCTLKSPLAGDHSSRVGKENIFLGGILQCRQHTQQADNTHNKDVHMLICLSKDRVWCSGWFKEC